MNILNIRCERASEREKVKIWKQDGRRCDREQKRKSEKEKTGNLEKGREKQREREGERVCEQR